MRVSLIQTNIHWADIQANIAKFESQLEGLRGTTDLVILPEMFNTGFCVNRMDLAQSMDGQLVHTVKRWASKFNFAICGSFIATENKKLYNRAFFVTPSGEFSHADKHNLFSYGGEDKIFTAGDSALIIKYLGFNIQLLICFDVRFPVWSYNSNNKYDLLIYVANFPAKRIAHWDVLLKARAVENQAYVIGLNRVGVDGLGVEYNGHSAVYDFHANTLLDFDENEDSTKTIKIDAESLHNYRTKFYIPKNELLH